MFELFARLCSDSLALGIVGWDVGAASTKAAKETIEELNLPESHKMKDFE